MGCPALHWAALSHPELPWLLWAALAALRLPWARQPRAAPGQPRTVPGIQKQPKLAKPSKNKAFWFSVAETIVKTKENIDF